MSQLLRRPLLLFTLAFITGDASYTHGGTGAACIAASLGIGAFAFLSRFSDKAWRGLIILFLAGVGVGVGRTAAHQTLAATDVSHFAKANPFVRVTGHVASEPDLRHGTNTFVLRAEHIERWGRHADVTGDVWVSVSPGHEWGSSLPNDATKRGASVVDYGDRITVAGRLDVPSGQRNPGGFSWRSYLTHREIHCELRVRKPADIAHHGVGGDPYRRVAAGMRRRLLEALHAALPPVAASVLSGILIGVRTELPPDLMADFIHTGTVHILASAGLHVGIIAFWLFALLRVLTVHRRMSAVLTILLLILFCTLASGRPSVTRAVIMASVYLASLLIERESDLPTTISVAALIILGLNPSDLFIEGFLLSFFTVISLTISMPVWDLWWRQCVAAKVRSRPGARAAHWAGEMLGLSILAQAGAAPIVAAFNSEVSLSGIPANLCAVPFLFVLIPLGFAGCLIGAFWSGAGAALLGIAGWGLHAVEAIVRWFGGAGWGYQAIAPPHPILIIGYYGALFAASRFIAARVTVQAHDVHTTMNSEGAVA